VPRPRRAAHRLPALRAAGTAGPSRWTSCAGGPTRSTA
jgi:hypothetical protein